MKLFQNFVVGILFAGSLALVGYFTVLSDSGPFARQGQQLVLYLQFLQLLELVQIDSVRTHILHLKFETCFTSSIS